MGGCFPCFGSSKKGGNGVKEVGKKEVKDASAAQSHHVTRVGSGSTLLFILFFSCFFFLGF